MFYPTLSFCGLRARWPGALIGIFLAISSVHAAEDRPYTPGEGSAERNAILKRLHEEYTTGSGAAVKFKVNYLKVQSGWAWINVTPLDPSGEQEGEEWPSLLQKKDGEWELIDMVAIAEQLDDPVGPTEPSAEFRRELMRRYPTLPAAIIPPA